MALTTKEVNYISALVQVSGETIDLATRIEYLVAEYFKGMSDRVGSGAVQLNSDLAAIGAFQHLSADRIAAVITAISAIQAALGDYTSGNLGNLQNAVEASPL